MNRRKLDRLWQDLQGARNSPQRAGDLESLAGRCGREMRPGSKHPMWVSTVFPHRPFPIPRHGKKDISIGVRNVILDHLETDAAAWEDQLDQEEAANKIEAESEGAKRGSKENGETG